MALLLGCTPPATPAPAEPEEPPREARFAVIDVHEHLETPRDAALLLGEMDRLAVARACLVASTRYTFTGDKRYGFEGHEENNEALLAIKRSHPERFSAFVTLDPLADGNLERLRGYVARGADGLKLYLGHGGSHGKGPFHAMSLDDERMRPVFAWAEEVQLPITLHVNLIKFFDELLALMERFPYLRVNLPHFGLYNGGVKRRARLAWLLGRYPNLYTDLSFGSRDIQKGGFATLSGDAERVRAWLEENAHKVLFASDMVLEHHKEEAYVHDTLLSYFLLLEEPSFRFFLEPDEPMPGLALPEAALREIYERTPARFLLLAADGAPPDRPGGWPRPGDPVPGRPPAVPEVPPLAPGEGPP